MHAGLLVFVYHIALVATTLTTTTLTRPKQKLIRLLDISSREGDECCFHRELGMEHVGREPAGFRLLSGTCPLCANSGTCRHGPLQGMGVSKRVGGRAGGMLTACFHYSHIYTIPSLVSSMLGQSY